VNILITSASRKVALVQTFKKALAEFGGGRVIAADITPLAPALFHADAGLLIKRSDDPEFIDHLIELCRREYVELLVPTRDEELPILAAAKERFASTGVTVMIGSHETVRICQDKIEFVKFCVRNRIQTAKIYPSADEILPDAFPVFVRSRFSKGSKAAFCANDARELRKICENVSEPLIQEFVRVREYTIDLFSDFNGRVISVVPRERISVISGESYVSRTTKSKLLIDAATDLAAKLHLVGHNTIQCFFDGATVKFIEVNPRFGGAAALGFAAGACTPAYLIRAVRGEALQPVIGEFEDTLTMLRYTQDIFVSPQQLSEIKCFD
jgi:carbamoyl-phosphate synthase large subunit